MSRLSARDLVERHGSYWQPLLPFGDAYVRQVNLQLRERLFPPFDGQSEPSRRAFINELSFEVCSRLYPMAVSDSVAHETTQQAADDVYQRVARYEGKPAGAAEAELTSDDIDEVLALSRRLSEFIQTQLKPSNALFHPSIAGVGVVGQVNPDIIADNTIIEVKNGERAFRIIDFRQILLYTALATASPNSRLDQLCLVNPRQGIFFLSSIDEACRSISGRGAVDLLSEINFLLTQDGTY